MMTSTIATIETNSATWDGARCRGIRICLVVFFLPTKSCWLALPPSHPGAAQDSQAQAVRNALTLVLHRPPELAGLVGSYFVGRVRKGRLETESSAMDLTDATAHQAEMSELDADMSGWPGWSNRGCARTRPAPTPFQVGSQWKPKL